MNKFSASKSDTEKVNIYNTVAAEMANQDPFKAEDYAIKAKNIALKKRYLKGVACSYRNLSLIKYYQVKYSESLEFADTSYKFYESIHDKNGQARALNLKGLIYKNQGYYDKAMDYYSQCEILRKFCGDSAGLAGIYNNMALIFMHQLNYSKALVYLQKALQLSEKYEPKLATGLILYNIGDIYLINKNAPKAFEYYNKALNIYIEANDLQGLANAYRCLGDYYNQIKDSKNAIKNFEKSHELACQIKIGYEIESALIGLSESYRNSGNYKKAYDYYVMYNEQSDKNNSDDVSKKITQLEMNKQFQNERTLHILKQQKKDIEAQRNIEKQKNIRNFAVVVILFFAIIIVLVYRNYRIKKRDNQILKAQRDEIHQKNIDISQRNEEIITQRDQLQILNTELSQRNEEITAQRDEIESQRDAITEQKNIIQEQKERTEYIYSELQDSILYAKEIQQAVLPSDVDLKQIFENYFILFRPLHIVSGDFYWIHKRNNYILIAVADCTGHGVPGGFMSMLGISLLNEITSRTDIFHANEVLNELREKIIFSLNQRGVSGEQQDGMDIAFCAINTDTLEMQFAGANNPVWIVEMCHGASQQPELIELKGDKMPIGIFRRMTPFTNQLFQLHKGDIIYFMSDGFIDQFGGPNRKKFLSQNLKQLLQDNSQKPIAAQKEILENTLDNWMGIGEQIDDITVMGIKL